MPLSSEDAAYRRLEARAEKVSAKNLLFVDNTGGAFFQLSQECPELEVAIRAHAPLPEGVADLFTVTYVANLNPNGTDRAIIRWA